MNSIKKYLKVLTGCTLISTALIIFFLNTNLIPSGILGFCILFNSKTHMNLALTVLLVNIFFFFLGLITIDKRELKKTILPFLAIPFLVYLLSFLSSIININDVEPTLLAIFGGVLMGLGYRIIYKENMFVSPSDIILLITREITRTRNYIINYVIDFVWFIIAIAFYGFEGALYSLIAIFIMENLSRRANLGISDSKVFYIITKKDKEVRKYIIDELHYELTMFDVKGGFLQTKNKVLMSVIPTKDYYKLKEGIKYIDPHAFISITDSYELIKTNK